MLSTDPYLKAHRNFDKIDSKYSLICWCIHLSYSFDISDKILTGLQSFLSFSSFFYTLGQLMQIWVYMRKNLCLSIHWALRFLARKPPKMSPKSLIILSGMSLDFETFLASNRLVAMNICSLSTFLIVKLEFNYWI